MTFGTFVSQSRSTAISVKSLSGGVGEFGPHKAGARGEVPRLEFPNAAKIQIHIYKSFKTAISQTSIELTSPMNAPCVIRFPETDYQPLTLELHQKLSEHLTVQNSPVLFGCRTGICGTCLVTVTGEISPPHEEEQEILEMLAPGNTQARLACQLDLTSDIEITPLLEDV